jgi:uncharacterized protein YkwD
MSKSIGIRGWLWAGLLSVMASACNAPGVREDSGATGSLHAPGDQWDMRDVQPKGALAVLTPAEQELVLYLNLVRANPRAYARYFIEPRLSLFIGHNYVDPLDARRAALRTKEGPAAVRETAQELSQVPGMGVLEVSRALSLAAKDHALDQSATGETGHTGSGGTLPGMRIEQYGQWENAVGEAIAYGPVSGREVVSRLLIDDGVPSRGHRRNILNPSFQLVGVAIASHPRYGWIAVIDLASDVLESGR